jgi:ADP-heptose:LPS heptosyltransferase
MSEAPKGRNDPGTAGPNARRAPTHLFRAFLRTARRRASDLKQELVFRMFTAHDQLALLRAQPSGPRADSLIMRTDGIGDFILWLDAAKELRRVAPLIGKLTLLAGRPNEELAETMGEFTEIWSLDRARFLSDLAYRRALLRKVARRGFAVVFNPVSARNPLIEDAVVRASRAPTRIGIAGDEANARHRQRVTNCWYTDLSPAAPYSLTELQRNRHFMRLFGVDYAVRVPEMPGRYPASPGLPSFGYYVIFPVASWPGKEWRIERFRALAERIFAATGLVGVVCGGAAERAVTAALCKGGDQFLLDLGGKTSLSQLTGIIVGARFVVSNDTSAAHIAAAVKVPSVVILGGGHFGRFLPYALDLPSPYAPIAVHAAMPCFGCSWRCIYPRGKTEPTACVDAVSLGQVWAEVNRILLGRPSSCCDGEDIGSCASEEARA